MSDPEFKQPAILYLPGRVCQEIAYTAAIPTGLVAGRLLSSVRTHVILTYFAHGNVSNSIIGASGPRTRFKGKLARSYFS